MGGIKKINGNFNRKNLLNGIQQVGGALSDMHKEYKLMKSHNYKNLDDYHHCKANYNAAKRGKVGEITAEAAGNLKEGFDYYWNQKYKGLSKKDAMMDYINDTSINQYGRNKAKVNHWKSAQDACADLRSNKAFPEKYW